MNSLRGTCYSGLSVTMPHKTDIIPYLDELSKVATLVGAVNTVLCKGGILEGHNTDGAGCVGALETNGITVKGQNVVLLGAGGAARASAIALAMEGASSIYIINRTLSKAQELAEVVRSVSDTNVTTSNIEDLEDLTGQLDILINATSMGMISVDKTLQIPEYFITSDMAVLDMVYDPIETELIRCARKVGAKAIPGTEMLLHQGALQFKLFTGRDAPLEVMRDALASNEEV